MRTLTRSTICAAMTGLLILATAAVPSAAMEASLQVKASITFVQPSTATKVADLDTGRLPRHAGYRQISLSTDGSVRATGANGDVTAQGHPSVININNTRDTMVNFVPMNYRPGGGIGGMHANCALQAGGQSCTAAPVHAGARTIYIGMDMTVADGAKLERGASSRPPSFDMSIVYQ